MPSQKHVEQKKKQREKKKKMLRRQQHVHPQFSSQPREDAMRDLLTGKEIRGLRKMSEVLLEFVDPFMEEATDERSLDGLLCFGMNVWNASLLPEHEMMSKRNGLLAEFPGEIVHLLRDRFDFLLARKALYFSSDKRTILTFKAEWNRYGPYLQVVSTPQPGTFSFE